MGKKKKNKHKKSKVKVQCEIHDFGAFKIEKIGKTLIYKSNLTQQEHKKNIERIKKNRPKFKQDIDNKINEVLSIIEKYNPFSLLQNIVFENQILNLEDYQESTEDRFEIFIEYAQSLIVSCKKHGWGNNPNKEVLGKFSKLIKEIVFDTVWYFGTEFAEKYSEDSEIQIREEIRFKSISNYLFMRGDSFESHDKEMINDLFTKHSAFFKSHYDLTYNQIIDGIYSIKQSIEDNLNSQLQVMIELKKTHEIFCDWVVTQDDSLSQEELIEKFHKIPEIIKINKKAQKLQPKEDYMIIAPSNKIPKKLLKILSTDLGNNEMFLQFNKCWPINDTIIYEKPLIEHNHKYYCFFYPILGRNVRHLLEKMIKDKDNKYFDEYYLKRGRDTYLENKSTEYFHDIFPQANIYQNMRYKIDKEEFETDILIEFDRNLLIVEAKANALKLSSRRGSLVSIKTDTKKILKKAYEQAIRTRNYIRDNVKAKFKFKNGKELFIDSNSYDNIYLVNVTLDKLDFLATELADMKIFGLNKSENWFWSVFLNDLRIISELIEFPSEFLLYLNRRLQVIEHQFYSSDELDYFMFFLEQGLYFEPDDLLGINKFVPDGYRDKLDRYYFFKRGLVSSGERPSLRISDKYKELIVAIESTNKKHFSLVTVSLISMSEESRLDILENIDKINQQLKLDNQPHSFTLPFSALNIGFIFCIGNNEDDFSKKINLEKYCRIKMEQMNINRWVAIKFIKEINFKELDFTIYFRENSNKEMISVEVEKFRKEKMEKYFSKHHKIGRNELCPCGSGKKYKKCCGKLF